MRLVARALVLASAVMSHGMAELHGQDTPPSKEVPKTPEYGKTTKKPRPRKIEIGDFRAEDKAKDLARLVAESKNALVRKQAARALGRLGTRARIVVADLHTALKAEADTDVKEALTSAIEQIDPPFEKLDARELIRRLTSTDEDLKTRKEMVKALANPRFVNDQYVGLLLEALLLDEELAADAATTLDAHEKLRPAAKKKKS